MRKCKYWWFDSSNILILGNFWNSFSKLYYNPYPTQIRKFICGRKFGLVVHLVWQCKNLWNWKWDDFSQLDNYIWEYSIFYQSCIDTFGEGAIDSSLRLHMYHNLQYNSAIPQVNSHSCNNPYLLVSFILQNTGKMCLLCFYPCFNQAWWVPDFHLGERSDRNWVSGSHRAQIDLIQIGCKYFIPLGTTNSFAL